MCFAEVILPAAIWKMPRVHDKVSVTLIIHTDAEDCPWRMTVSAVLAASVTNHQVIILLVCRIASASMTTFSTHCISMTIKTIYIWWVQVEVLCDAESACVKIWEGNKIPKKGEGLIKTCYLKLCEIQPSARQVLSCNSARLPFPIIYLTLRGPGELRAKLV